MPSNVAAKKNGLMAKEQVLAELNQFLDSANVKPDMSVMQKVIVMHQCEPELFFNLAVVGLPGSKHANQVLGVLLAVKQLTFLRAGFTVEGHGTNGQIRFLEAGREPLNFHSIPVEVVRNFCAELLGASSGDDRKSKVGKMVGRRVSEAQVRFRLGGPG